MSRAVRIAEGLVSALMGAAALDRGDARILVTWGSLPYVAAAIALLLAIWKIEGKHESRTGVAGLDVRCR